jgi:hypothetical protein
MIGGAAYLFYLKRKRQDLIEGMGRVFEDSDGHEAPAESLDSGAAPQPARENS